MIREVIEKCKKKTEADGGYGDLGAIPSAPSDLGKKKGKENLIVDGEVVERNEDEMGIFIGKLMRKEIDPKDYNKEKERVEKTTGSKIYKNLSCTGCSSISNDVNYKKYYNNPKADLTKR